MNLILLRRLSQILFMALILLMPLLNILRYDSDTKELFVFGKVWSLGITPEDITKGSNEEDSKNRVIVWKIFLKALIPWVVLLSIFPLLGFFLGRFFCGWLCPEGTLFEWADFLTQKLTGKRTIWDKRLLQNPSANAFSLANRRQKNLYAGLVSLSLLLIPPVIGIGLSGYFISPERIFKELSTFQISTGLKAGIIGVSIYIITTSIFVRHVLCKYICAAGLMQTLFGWVSPISLRIRFIKEKASFCSDCRKCETVCFMNIKPRKNTRDIWCVNCCKCIEACKTELPEPLFKLQFGNNIGHSQVIEYKKEVQHGNT